MDGFSIFLIFKLLFFNLDVSFYLIFEASTARTVHRSQMGKEYHTGRFLHATIEVQLILLLFQNA